MTTPQCLSDRYELGELLGFGGMSEVYRARDTRLGRDVAVKILRADLARDPSFYSRFRREAQNAGALNHPAIVAIYDTGEVHTPSGTLPYIVMELVEGTTLRDIIHTHGPMEPMRAIEIVADVCQALNFSHQHGIIHRDVKPANIMITPSNAVKVMDFGIARAMSDMNSTVTQTAAVMGTAQYLSPEQARGESVDARSDVYSLGCVLYEMLTGDAPFVGDSPVSVAYQHVREDPVLPSSRHPGIPADLDAVVLKALAKNPDNRYQTAAEFRSDLVRVRNGQTPMAPKVLAPEQEFLDNDLPEHSLDDEAIMPYRSQDFSDQPLSRSLNKPLLISVIIVVLTLVVAGGINIAGGRVHRIQIPDVTGQVSADAIVALQNRGLRAHTEQKADPVVPPDHVISTNPPANSAVNKNDKVTLYISYGPEQRQLPDVTSLTYAEAVKKLRSAGFSKFRRVTAPSSIELQDKVIQTTPKANQTTAITNEITISIGTGPDVKPLPDVVGQTEEVAQKDLSVHGFTTMTHINVDSPRPAGEVIGMNPPAGESVTLDTVIELKVSKGNQFLMPDLMGMFWVDAEPQLHALGWTGILIKGADIDAGPAARNRVLYQSPPPGEGINRDGNITLRFGQ